MNWSFSNSAALSSQTRLGLTRFGSINYPLLQMKFIRLFPKLRICVSFWATDPAPLDILPLKNIWPPIFFPKILQIWPKRKRKAIGAVLPRFGIALRSSIVTSSKPYMKQVFPQWRSSLLHPSFQKMEQLRIGSYHRSGQHWKQVSFRLSTATWYSIQLKVEPYFQPKC